MSPQMRSAIDQFCLVLPSGCTLRPQETRPIYTLVTIDGWPRDVHYEFRTRNEGKELYVEIHIENRKYLFLRDVLESVVTELPTVQNFSLEYFEARPWPHRKKWPSASIALPPHVDGTTAAFVMQELIAATRGTLGRALAAQID
jgi:hypothetical protein